MLLKNTNDARDALKAIVQRTTDIREEVQDLGKFLDELDRAAELPHAAEQDTTDALIQKITRGIIDETSLTYIDAHEIVRVLREHLVS